MGGDDTWLGLAILGAFIGRIAGALGDLTGAGIGTHRLNPRRTLYLAPD